MSGAARPRQSGAPAQTTPGKNASPPRASSKSPAPAVASARPRGNMTMTKLLNLEAIPVAQLEMGEEIGKGKFKHVRRGKFRRKDVVVLKYAKEEAQGNEVQTLALLASNCRAQAAEVGPENAFRYVPEIYGIVTERDTVALLQELAPFGSLENCIKDPAMTGRVSPAHRLYIAAQMSRGMDFLMQNRVVHADLSCRNILIYRFEDDSPQTVSAKLTDFGLSVILEENTDSIIKKQPRAVRWCSPETILEQKLSFRSDTWALGCLIWEMFANCQAPWCNITKRTEVTTRIQDIGKQYQDSVIAANGGDAVMVRAAQKGEAVGVVLKPGDEPDLKEDFPWLPGMPTDGYRALLSCLKVNEFARPIFLEVAEKFENASLDEPNKENAIAERRDSVKSLEEPAAVGPQSRYGSPAGRRQMAAERLLADLQRELALDPEGEDRLGSSGLFDSTSNVASILGAKFSKCKDFLKGPRAQEVIDADSALIMWREVEEQQAREAYLVDLVRRMQAALANPQPVANGPLPQSAPSEEAVAGGPGDIGAMAGGNCWGGNGACPVPGVGSLAWPSPPLSACSWVDSGVGGIHSNGCSLSLAAAPMVHPGGSCPGSFLPPAAWQGLWSGSGASCYAAPVFPGSLSPPVQVIRSPRRSLEPSADIFHAAGRGLVGPLLAPPYGGPMGWSDNCQPMLHFRRVYYGDHPDRALHRR